jgi:all-trans-8'-apo-beta-carotenal 15,15'-oxygenase
MRESMRREHGFEPLRVEGEVPEALRGTLYRVGPGLFEAQGRRYGHIFEGDGAVCAVRFDGGRASGAHRLVRSEGLREERDVGRPLYGTVASWPRRVVNALRMRAKNAANTNLLVWQNRLFALFEPSRPTELSFELDTLGERDLDGAVITALSAHPHAVAKHDAIYNFGVRYGRTTHLDLFRLPAQGPAERLGSVPLRAPVMLHDFIATERHLVFFVSPAMIRVVRALLGLNPFEHLVGWRPERGTEVIVVPIDDPERATRFDVDAFYQWHFSNAFEQNGELFVDFVKYANLDTLGALTEGVEHIEGGKLTRARVDPRRGRLVHEELDDVPSEFPRMDPRWEGGFYERLWLSQGSSLSQHDLGAGRRAEHRLPAGHFASEPVFVPRSAKAPQGDGWVLALVYDHGTALSYVSVVDTARFDDEPVARVWFDHHVPITFHGVWAPAR